MLSGAHARLRHRLDLPSRLKSAVTGAPTRWIGGALVAGFTASLLLRAGKKKVPAKAAAIRKERGFLLGSLALLFTLFKPAVKIYATKLLKDYLTRRFQGGAESRPGAVRTPPY
jgi:hypothetical protein